MWRVAVLVWKRLPFSSVRLVVVLPTIVGRQVLIAAGDSGSTAMCGGSVLAS